MKPIWLKFQGLRLGTVEGKLVALCNHFYISIPNTSAKEISGGRKAPESDSLSLNINLVSFTVFLTGILCLKEISQFVYILGSTKNKSILDLTQLQIS